MKIWVLRERRKNNNRYDVADGFVIAAETSYEARKLAAADCGSEGPGFWMNAEYSTCNEVRAESRKAGVIQRSYHHG